MPSAPEPSNPSRRPIALLLALDVLLVVALFRAPTRLELPPVLDDVPLHAPGLAAVTDRSALFVVTGASRDATTTFVRVPLDTTAPALEREIGQDFALDEPVQSLDAFMPTGARWAWNGTALLLAAPSRALGADRVYVALVSDHGPIGTTHTIEGTRPSAGWARDHFEVAYVTPAPPPDVGRVQWVVDVDASGNLAHEHIVSPAGVAHTPFAWPGGVRTPVQGAEPDQRMLQDGTIVNAPRETGRRARPFARLNADGRIAMRFMHSSVLSGSALSGDYVAETTDGVVAVRAHMGAHVARLSYTISRGNVSRTFEADREAFIPGTIVVEREGVLHVVDSRGFHARFRASDLAPLEPRISRFTWFAGALGPLWFWSAAAGLVLAHALALVIERAARGNRRAQRLATLAALSMLFFGGAAVLSIWSAL